MRELASVIWTEARAVGDAAMSAVGWTVRNRMSRNSVRQVDEAWRGYTHDGRPSGSDLAHAEAIARSILAGTTPDLTNGSTHFYSPQAMPTTKDKELKGVDVGGGLESVPGVKDAEGRPIENYRPVWTRTFTAEPVKDVPEAAFKFYRPRNNSPVR
ncbi:hypothetical protein [Lichenicoccus sp.]|uniref:hypothetical protein n=1 Tax=Lichenicoccus sp. TaxID=2781899 RepID=UPI003D0AA4D9